MSSLRLKATGERLVWWPHPIDSGQYLSRESRREDAARWFAGATTRGGACYDTDAWFGGSEILNRHVLMETMAVDAQKLLCEKALISAGIAEEEEPFPSD